MFTVCVGLKFFSKYVQLRTICSLQYSININTVQVDPHSNLLQNGIGFVLHHVFIIFRVGCSEQVSTCFVLCISAVQFVSEL